MEQGRRQFVVQAGMGAMAMGFLPQLAARVLASDFGRITPAERPLKILFLGGTGFIGPHAVRYALGRGHEVTLFNRGSRDELFPELELIKGNRIVDVEPGLDPLREQVDKGRRWDAVIDTASVHTWVEHSAALLKDAASHYEVISSLSVYTDNSVINQDESGDLAEMPDEVADSIDRLPYDMTYYGAVKVRCERAAETHFPGHATVLRPGLIVGPRDFSHRFTYWPLRVRDGGEVLAPGTPDTRVMFIDARDLAMFMIRVLEDRAYGIFNANGPVGGEMTMGGLLDACKRVTGSDATFTWASAEFLQEHGVGAWLDMPVWVPPSDGMEGFHTMSVARAAAAGLTTRGVDETVRDTISWFDGWLPGARERAQERNPESAWDYKPGETVPGITRDRERELLAELHENG